MHPRTILLGLRCVVCMSKNTLGCTGSVLVHWQDDAAYYAAVIDDYDGKSRYHLMYDDAHEEWIDLPNDDVKFMPLGWRQNDASSGILSLLFFSRAHTHYNAKCGRAAAARHRAGPNA